MKQRTFEWMVSQVPEEMQQPVSHLVEAYHAQLKEMYRWRSLVIWSQAVAIIEFVILVVIMWSQ